MAADQANGVASGNVVIKVDAIVDKPPKLVTNLCPINLIFWATMIYIPVFVIIAIVFRDHFISEKCGTGLTFNFTQSVCVDIDECVIENPCSINETCKNRLYGFHCKCRVGFSRVHDDSRCLDIDECQQEPCRSSETCVDLIAHRVCCPSGYSWDVENEGCVDINECDILPTKCNGLLKRCINVIGGYNCGCKDGSRFDHVSRGCVDIDECSTYAHNCSVHEKCVNLDPGFKCVCKNLIQILNPFLYGPCRLY